MTSDLNPEISGPEPDTHDIIRSLERKSARLENRIAGLKKEKLAIDNALAALGKGTRQKPNGVVKRVLTWLADHDSPFGSEELAKALEISAPDASHAIHRLKKQGELIVLKGGKGRRGAIYRRAEKPPAP